MLLVYLYFVSKIPNIIKQDVFGKKSYIATQGNIHLLSVTKIINIKYELASNLKIHCINVLHLHF